MSVVQGITPDSLAKGREKRSMVWHQAAGTPVVPDAAVLLSFRFCDATHVPMQWNHLKQCKKKANTKPPWISRFALLWCLMWALHSLQPWTQPRLVQDHRAGQSMGLVVQQKHKSRIQKFNSYCIGWEDTVWAFPSASLFSASFPGKNVRNMSPVMLLWAVCALHIEFLLFFPLLLFSPEGPHEKEGEGGLVWFLFAFKCSFISQSVMQSLYSGLCRGLCLLRTTGSARGKI